jgi:hypothetical protein
MERIRTFEEGGPRQVSVSVFLKILVVSARLNSYLPQEYWRQ